MINRRRLLVNGVALAACAVAARPAWSATALSGNVTQGALLRGRVAPPLVERIADPALPDLETPA